MSAVITPFEGTELFNTASFNNRISQINTGFSYVSNPNLLDNWYFGRPVNQRGKSEYTGNGYTVDRWSLSTDGGNVTISNGYLDIYASKQHGTYLAQKIDPELAKAIAGKTVTWSVLAVGGDSAFSANINKNDSYVDSFTIEPNTISFKTLTFPTDFTDISFVFAGNFAGHVCPIAAKLELGSTQTLAHREGDRWVMNEVPEYGEQLRRCQRYYLRIKASSAYMRFGVSTPYTDTSAGAFIQFPNQMRAVPVLSFGGNFALFDGGQFHSVTLSSDTMSPYNATLQLTGSTQPTKGAQLLAYNDDNAYIAFSADL